MNTSKTLKMLLIFICSAALLLTGCGAAPTTSGGTGKASSETAFDELTMEIFKNYASSDTLTLNYTLKDPSAYGIEMDEPTWGELSLTDDDFAEDKAQTQSYLDRLNAITGLEGDRALTYDVLKYYLEAELEGYDYMFLANNLAPMLGFQSQFPTTMAEYHFDTVSNVDDYIALLDSLDDYAAQIAQFENLKAEAGYGMCRSALEEAIADCQSFIDNPEANLLIEVFPAKLDELGGLSDDEKNSYIEKNNAAVTNSVIPAYQTLIDCLTAQLDSAPEEGNLSSYAKGQDYYKYLLKSSVGTDKTPEDLIELTEEKLNTSLFSLAMIMQANPNIFDDFANAEFSLTDPTEIIEHFKSTLLTEQFPAAPEASYTLKNVPESLSDTLSPAMYYIPRIDDTTNNQIYLNLTENVGNQLMPTLAHEGYPGHMYQITYYFNTKPDPVRNVYENLGYVEGWASYVEGLSYYYCGFNEDLADFSSIYSNAFALNLYCRMDLGIHYEGWSLAEAAEFIGQYLTMDDGAVEEIYNIVLYNPTNYLVYGIGMDEILELKENMEENQDENFDVKEFHKQLLDLGPAPFSIIKKYMPDAAEAETESASK
ncbi:MAG: DUF885 domain-containing protein [Clostridia bacterium]|nr:DUF885 domain-containing protein [Lachnospiraceae bacterium]NCB99405.1 DUF885 domain-containing protein [Clostridia bacterium]NCD01492.1 DUF885 domain-containing protein [Clostridia bacterium]